MALQHLSTRSVRATSIRLSALIYEAHAAPESRISETDQSMRPTKASQLLNSSETPQGPLSQEHAAMMTFLLRFEAPSSFERSPLDPKPKTPNLTAARHFMDSWAMAGNPGPDK